jgi:hypothetical protein
MAVTHSTASPGAASSTLMSLHVARHGRHAILNETHSHLGGLRYCESFSLTGFQLAGRSRPICLDIGPINRCSVQRSLCFARSWRRR